MHRPALTIVLAGLASSAVAAHLFAVPAVAGRVHGSIDGGVMDSQSRVEASRTASAFRVRLPEPTSSFGAVASDGYLYVYGGHVARTHAYSTSAMSGRFSRLALDGGTEWETLPEGPKLQGMNLAAHDGQIYRVGGMEARNTQGTKQDLHSVAEVSRFDPAAARWEALPPLPTPRSSHDVVAAEGKLYVVGGWNMIGGQATVWADTVDVLDLTSPSPAWRSIRQPFERRALIAAVQDGRLYVLGGIDDRDEIETTVNVLDLRTETWSEGPSLPKGSVNGFGPAACTVAGRLYLSVADGGVHRLRGDRSGWDAVGANTPRIVHRLIPDGGRILVVGGADKGTNLDLIEVVDPGLPAPE